jgi:hypothetical protein
VLAAYRWRARRSSAWLRTRSASSGSETGWSDRRSPRNRLIRSEESAKPVDPAESNRILSTSQRPNRVWRDFFVRKKVLFLNGRFFY